MGIPSDLRLRLVDTLSKCTAFDSHAELKAVFVDDRLYFLRDRVPENTSKASRVNQVIEFLHNTYNANEENALVLLLQVLSGETSPGDSSHHQLAALVEEVKSALDFSPAALSRTAVDETTTWVKYPYLNTAPPLPANFVARPEVLEQAQKAILESRLDHKMAVTILHGMGGIGKSALATAICHSREIQDKFCDGIIWVTVGPETDDLKDQMRLIAQALNDPVDYWMTCQSGINRLRTILPEKSMLIVLDDVWETRHVEAFQIQAPHCHLLVTSRDSQAGALSNAAALRLDPLTTEQSVSLLRAWAGRDDAALSEIVHRLGALPLALKLTGIRLRNGLDGAEWLRNFEHISQVKLGRRATTPQENLEACLELSLSQLAEEDRLLYCVLGIFPKAIALPRSVIARLWHSLDPGLDFIECDDILTELGRLNLIGVEPQSQTVTIHSVLHDYIATRLTGERFVATNRALLAAYNPSGKPWHEVEDDGYLYSWLGHHLLKAEREDEFLELLTGSPHWLKTKSAVYNDNGSYLSDLDLAIKHIGQPETPAGILTLVKLLAARKAALACDVNYPTTYALTALTCLNRESAALRYARRQDLLWRCVSLWAVYEAKSRRGQRDFDLLVEIQRAAQRLDAIPEKMRVWPALLKEFKKTEQSSWYQQLLDRLLDDIRAVQNISKRIALLIELTHELAPAEDYPITRALFVEVCHQASEIEERDPQILMSRVIPMLHAILSAPVSVRQPQALISVLEHVETQITKTWLIFSQIHALTVLATGWASVGRWDRVSDLQQMIPEGKTNAREDFLGTVAGNLARMGCVDASRKIFFELHAPSDHIETCKALATALARTGEAEGAWDIVESLEDTALKSQAYCGLIEPLVKATQFDAARQSVLKIPDKAEQMRVGFTLIKAMIEAEKIEKARDAARELKVAFELRELPENRYLVFYLALSGEIDEAVDVILSDRPVPGLFYDRGFLFRIAYVLAQISETQAAQRIFESAEQKARANQSSEPHTFISLAAGLAVRVGQAGYVEMGRQILNMAERLSQEHHNDRAFADLFRALARFGRFERAAHIKQQIGHKFDRTLVPYFATTLALAGKADEAISAACSIDNDDCRISALFGLVVPLVYGGFAREAARALDRAVDEVTFKAQWDDSVWSPLWRNLVTVFAHVNMPELTEQLLALELGVRIATSVIDNLARMGRIDEALAQAKGGSREEMSLSLVAALIQAGRLSEAETLAENPGDLCQIAVMLSATSLPRAHTILNDVRDRLGDSDTESHIAFIVALAKTQRLASSLKYLSDYFPLMSFVLGLIELLPVFNQVTPDLGLLVLQSATGIAAWIDPTWGEINSLLVAGFTDEITQTPPLTLTPEAGSTASLNFEPGQHTMAAIAYLEGQSHFKAEKYADALVAVNRSLDLNPQNGETELLRSQIYLQLSDAPAALTSANCVIDLYPNNYRYYVARGKIHYEANQLFSALSDFTKAIEIESNTPSETPQMIKYVEHYRERGKTHFLLDRFDEAVADFERAIVLSSGASKWYDYQWRALAHVALGHCAKAWDDMSQAIAMAPKTTDSYFFRALIALEMGQYCEALADLDKGTAYDKTATDRSYNHFWRAVIYALLAQTSAADQNLALSLEASKEISERDVQLRALSLNALFQGESSLAYHYAEQFLTPEIKLYRFSSYRTYLILLEKLFPQREDIRQFSFWFEGQWKALLTEAPGENISGPVA